MDDALLVRVLDGVADLDEQLEPRGDLAGDLSSQYVRDAASRRRTPSRRTADRRRRAGVEDAGDARMIQQREGLPLGLEAGAAPARDPMPSLMSLIATTRRMGSCCSARYTMPMPPSPRRRRIR